MTAALARRRWIAPGILFLTLASALAWYALQIRSGPAVAAVHPERMDIVQTVVATGRIATEARIEIGASITGTVTTVNVRDGQRVHAGDLLFTLDAAEAQATLAQALAGVAQARAGLEQLSAVTARISEQNAQQTAANLHVAEREMRRAHDLFAKGFLSQSRVDEAMRTLELARAQHANSATQRTATQPQGADYRLAVRAIETAEAAQKLAEARHALTVIRSPVDGTVVRRNVEPGNVVSAGRAVIEIARAGGTQIIAQIDEKNLALLAIGQKALAAADAYPDRPFAAELYYINPGIDAQRGTVEVKLRVPTPALFLLPDMTTSVEIKVAEKRNALTLPAAYVRELANDPWVLKVVAARTVRQNVRLGIRGAKRLEILQGLESSELVLEPGVELGIGKPVRPVIAPTIR